jgi:hypothetical protein
VNILEGSIGGFSLKDDGGWRILIPITGRKQSLIPLTDSQKPMSLIANFKVVSRIEAKAMFCLDSGGCIGKVNIAD